MPKDVHRSLELLEEYHAELFRPSDNELKFYVEKVIGLFKTNLFSALCDLQEFYDTVLLNQHLSPAQKIYETRRFADRWKHGPFGSVSKAAPSLPQQQQQVGGAVPAATGPPVTSSLANNQQAYSTGHPLPPNQFLHTSNVNRLVDEFGREWEVEEVLVDASQIGLGFSISGGQDREPEPDHHIRVTDISPGGAIAANGHLRVGDVILRVNEVDCSNVDHQVAVGALQRAGAFVRLLIKRLKVQRSQSQPRLNESTACMTTTASLLSPIDNERQRALSGSAVNKTCVAYHAGAQSTRPLPSPHQSQSRMSTHSNNTANAMAPVGHSAKAPRLVTLFKSDAGLGFNIVGGEDNEPIYVSHVLPGGAADITGNVRKGDVLLRVNDTSMQNITHAEAAYVLKSVPSNSYVSILLQYRPKEYHDFEEKVIRLQNDTRY